MKNTINRITILFLGCILVYAQQASAQVKNSRADSSVSAYNEAFLTKLGGRTYYKRALNDTEHDGTWTLALDIQGMEDAYERTGDPDQRALVNDLCSSFLLFNPTPYSWDGWNDDLAWMALVMARGHQMTGTQNFLTEAESTFNLAFDRGWNTEFNDGGIWEQQPDYVDTDAGTNKEALSNNPMGQLACMLYQSTGNEYYLEKAKQIYEWSVSHIFNPKNGQVYTGVYRNGHINLGKAVYNQGTFIDFSTLLYEITGDERVLRNAIMAADYTVSELTTNEQILSNAAEYLNTWAGEFARGLGHLCKQNPQLWDRYYDFLKKNDNIAWSNRRRDLHLTGNAWDQQTAEDSEGIPTKYVSAVALHQHTPVIQALGDDIVGKDYNFWMGASSENNTAKLTEGDWVEYMVNVSQSGSYTFTLNVSSASGAEVLIQQNRKGSAQFMVAANSESQTIKSVVRLTQGIHAIRFKVLSGECSMDSWSADHCDMIVPVVSVDNGAESQVAEVSVMAGADVVFAPTPTDGEWSWVGPNAFTSDSRSISLSNIQLTQGGTYTASYQDASGCISTKDFVVTIQGCDPTAVTGEVLVNKSGNWTEAGETIEAGSLIKIEGKPETGSWIWTGPNDFYSESSSISFINVGYAQAGEYIGTYINESGCKSTQSVQVTLTGDDPCSSAIIPYINVNGWKQVAYASVNAGGSFSVGPQPLEGSWSWVGPNGFTSDNREFSVENFTAEMAGYYTATYTNAAGCTSSMDFIIGLQGCDAASVEPEILVNGEPWTYTDSISIVSGGSLTITAPELEGSWSWIGSNGGEEKWDGANGFISNERVIHFENVTAIRQGTYTLTFVNDNACISHHSVDVYVLGDDYCGTAIVPFLNANDEGWKSVLNAEIEVGQSVTFGPQPLDDSRWNWTGPAGFTSKERQYTVENIQANGFGVYHAVCTNNLGCRSYADFTLSKKIEEQPSEVLGTDGTKVKATIYPNPAMQTVNLKEIKPGAKVSILDAQGRLLADPSWSDDHGRVSMDISHLSSGLYFIVIDGGGTLKLLKK